MHWGWQTGEWWMMGIGMVFWLVLALVSVWMLVRATAGSGRAEQRGEFSEELLRRRFAAGEIDAEEYERRLELLRRR